MREQGEWKVFFTAFFGTSHKFMQKQMGEFVKSTFKIFMQSDSITDHGKGMLR
jgi:hypothetical protein